MLNHETRPFQLKLSFKYLKEEMSRRLSDTNPAVELQAKQMLKIFEQNPKLITGFEEEESLVEHQAAIDQVMSFLFPAALSFNEIKTAVFPYSNESFYMSNRLRNIKNNAVKSLNEIFEEMFFHSLKEDEFNFLPYAIILNKYYNYNVDIERPLNMKVEQKDGIINSYKAFYNSTYLDIYPNENAIDITEEILDEIIKNANNKEVWVKFFPKNSWTLEGFAIFNFIDSTFDSKIDGFKSHLIEPNTKNSIDKILNDIKFLFNIKDLEIGYYRIEGEFLMPGYGDGISSLSVVEEGKDICTTYACKEVQEKLFENFETVILPDVEAYHKKNLGNTMTKALLEKNLKSVILIPIVVKEELAFIMEIGTPSKNSLNNFNAVKLDEILPYMKGYAEREKENFENQISAVIQQECTSIHPSVQWRFKEEAIRYIHNRNHNKDATFQEVVFENVTPLYGQIDIVGSSNARDKATKDDLTHLLTESGNILRNLSQNLNLPLYEQLEFKTKKYIQRVETEFQTNVEQEINQFYAKQIHPIFTHVAKTELKNEVTEFLSEIDIDTKTINKYRNNYDKTIDSINYKLSRFLEQKQIEAQEIFPHYFEKYKTDGIEHNLYVGATINYKTPYHPTVIDNLRLWQLKVVCEMEAMYYHSIKSYPVQLKVASLIFAYDKEITIRYRIDEKQFDVDGAYNVKYEMIKKRIDKAYVKNTNERITQPNKLVVVYSTDRIEREYLNYFEFLQSKEYIEEGYEVVELEELQGAHGLKALRANINTKKTHSKMIQIETEKQKTL